MASQVASSPPSDKRLTKSSHQTDKHPLFDDPDLNWKDKRRTLRPRYGIVWRDIALRHAMLIAGLAAHTFVWASFGQIAAVVCAPLVALWTGIWLVSLNNFAHEAAHFNLAKNRIWNDVLANWFVMSPFGMEARLYRKVHWSHHLHLGQAADTEVSYRNELTFPFLLQCLTGLYPLRVLSRHSQQSQATLPARQHSVRVRKALGWARAVLWHGAILAVLLSMGATPVALAWIAGLCVVFPTAAALRQILEHRSTAAPSAAADVPADSGDATNRLFGDGCFAGIFGSAGFNRHLLHHWDPAISYTRLADMERMLSSSKGPEFLQPYRATYFQTLRTLLKG